MIYCLRQVAVREKTADIFMVVADLTKTFESVNWDASCSVRKTTLIPDKIITFIISFLENIHGSVKLNDELSNSFLVKMEQCNDG